MSAGAELNHSAQILSLIWSIYTIQKLPQPENEISRYFTSHESQILASGSFKIGVPFSRYETKTVF